MHAYRVCLYYVASVLAYEYLCVSGMCVWMSMCKCIACVHMCACYCITRAYMCVNLYLYVYVCIEVCSRMNTLYE